MDREAEFGVIFEECFSKVIDYARRRVVHSEVDDVVSETFLVVWRRFEDVPPGTATLPWIYGVARRVVADRRRSGRRRERLTLRLGGLRFVGPDSTAGSDCDADVEAALWRVSEADRELLMLVYWEDLTTDEVALSLGVSVNAAKIRLHRARRRFAAALAHVEQASETGRNR